MQTPATPTDLSATHKLIEDTRARCLPEIESRLESFFRAQASKGLGFSAEMSSYHFSTGGKRLRALIPAFVYAAHGRDPLQALELGIGIELIHNATLVHDDLQDGDTVRRGQPTVWKKYSEAQAINCGDAMLSMGYDLIAGLESQGVDPAHVLRITRRALQSTLQVIEGQSQEFIMKDEPFPTTDRYLGVIRGKTGALIALPIAAALQAMGEDAAHISAAEKAAMDCGMLFQIQDDLLDIYGNKNRDQTATDIAEGKISIFVAYINEVAEKSEKETVARILRKPRVETTRTDIEQVLSIFNAYDCRGMAVHLIRELQRGVHAEQALNAHPRTRNLIAAFGELFLRPVRELL